MTNNPRGVEDEPSIELKDPAAAAFLAWLIPGLGHLYQGRIAKAVLFFTCIMGTFIYGLYLSGSSDMGWGRAVYFSMRKPDRRLHYVCQLPVGLAALPALVQANRVAGGKEPLFNGFMAPPRLSRANAGNHGDSSQVSLDMLNKRLNRFFDFGAVYTMVAGLLNILAIYDAWGGPVLPIPDPKEDDGEEDNKEKKTSKARTPNEDY